MKTFKILILFALLFLVPSDAFALRIDNPKMRIKVTMGQNYTGMVTVDNPSKDPVGVKVYLEDFIYVEPFDGGKKFMPRGTTSRTISDYITFSPENFILEPFGTKTVNFTISPTKPLKETLCGVLFFETSLGSSTEEGKAIDVLGRLGSLIFLDPADGKKSAVFSSPEGGDRKISGIISNSGNLFLSALGTFYVMDANGKVLDRGQTTEAYLMPGDKRPLEIKFVPSLPEGNYTVVVTFDMQDNDIFTKEIDFSISSSGEVKVTGSRD
jgi:hypothetical protein